MQAAVYRGKNQVRLEEVPVPEIGPGELLVRVHTCGICGTDLKKIATGSHSAPRIFGHETSGTVAAVGPGVTRFRVGDPVVFFHHIPCGNCFYCKRQLYSCCDNTNPKAYLGEQAFGYQTAGIFGYSHLTGG
ncbi:MAG TPA: alcohol dehydrogenase catalytic domain-containing protein, partial [Terriglobales bacterium]|nr:alcohol dehydrogenase catalytic domain-containing protein [Terriglobales bacterium]